jgi:predicted porin
MKKYLFPVAALIGFSSLAHAQSNVTLYGILDNALLFVNNNKNVVNGVNVGGRSLGLDANAGVSGSRWGLRGSEDLGRGMHAVFTLESGINVNNGAFGQGGTAFGRQAFVGLQGDRLGALTFGRQYDMIVVNVQPASTLMFVGGGLGEHPGDLDNFNDTLRTNNSVNYVSPSFKGLTFGAGVSMGGRPGSVSEGSGYSVGANYTGGPVRLGVAYLFFKNPTGTPGSGYFTSNQNGVSVLSGLMNSGYATANSYQVAALAGTYTVGKVSVGASYSNIQYANISALGGETATFNVLDLGAKYVFTPAFFMGLDYSYTKGNTVDGRVGNQHFNQISLMADYSVTKRTDIYLEAAFQAAAGMNSTGTAAIADIGATGDSSTSHQTAVRLSFRHRF